MVERWIPWRSELLTLVKKPWSWGILALVLLVGVLMAFDRGNNISIGGDFSMYWKAGQRFVNGEPLYLGPEIGFPYVYPPFAAFLFQAFSGFSLQGAAIFAVFANFIQAWLLVVLTYGTARVSGYSIRHSAMAVSLSVLFTGSYLWNNITYGQINIFLFVLMLFGILSMAEGRKGWAMVVWTMGVWIKVLPVFLIGWLLIRDFRLKWIGIGVGVSILCIGLPILQRGTSQGIKDLEGYYDFFLSKYAEGEVNAFYRNQNLAGAVLRTLTIEGEQEGYRFNWVEWDAATVQKALPWINLMMLLSLGGVIGWNRWKGRPMNLWEPAAILVFTHLISGLTWRGHLLTLLFIMLPFFLQLLRPKPKYWRIGELLIIILLLMPVVGTKNLLGEQGYMQIYGQNINTWHLVLMFGLSLWQAVKEGNRSSIEK